MTNNYVVGVCCFAVLGLASACLPKFLVPTEDYFNEQLQLVTTTTTTTITTTVETTTTTSIEFAVVSTEEIEVTTNVEDQTQIEG